MFVIKKNRFIVILNLLIYLKKINKVYTVQCKTLNSMNFNWICLENAGVCVVYVYACTCTNACVCFLQV